MTGGCCHTRGRRASENNLDATCGARFHGVCVTFKNEVRVRAPAHPHTTTVREDRTLRVVHATGASVDVGMVGRHDERMYEGTKRVTANLPSDLLHTAQEVTGKGITETLVDGLRLLRRSRAYEKGMALKGKIRLVINVESSRERARR